jgi:PKD repeat protein
LKKACILIILLLLAIPVALPNSVKVNAQIPEYSLSVNIVGSGSVAVNGSSPYAAGSVVQLTANPSYGWTFTQWNGDVLGIVNPEFLLMDSNKSVTCTFTAGGTPPVASFSTCSPVALVFADVMFDASASFDSDGTIVLYEWDWDGDGVYDADNTAPTGMGAQYTLPGIYNVGLRVTDNDGLTDTTSLTVTILSAEEFNKIPEVPFGTIMVTAAMGLGLIGYIVVKKPRKKKTE